MKLLAAFFGVMLSIMVPAHAQYVRWASTNALPNSFTNASITVNSVEDGAGGSVWLLHDIIHTNTPPYELIPAPQPGQWGVLPEPVVFQFVLIPAEQIVWIDKSGTTLLNENIGLNSQATIVRVTRNELVVQVRHLFAVGPAPLFLKTLRRYVNGKTGTTRNETDVYPNEVFTTSVNGNALAGADKTGFFSFSLGAPFTPEFIVRRYSTQ